MKKNLLNPVLILVLATIPALFAKAQQPSDSKTSTAPTSTGSAISQSAPRTGSPGGARYRIGAGDVLDIRIFNRPNLSRDAVRVEGDGNIRMPLIAGDIKAACKTEGELAKDIATGYLKYYRNPQVDVFIKEYHAREVAVIGAINQQGRYQMQRRIRLLELLTYAKGLTDKAGQTINIIHGNNPEICDGSANSEGDLAASFLSLRLSDTMRGDEKANPYMQAGDTVTVPEADQIYVVGNVYAPKTVPLKEPISVSSAVAMAGGVLRDSKTDQVRIVRQLPGTGTKSEIIVNLQAINRKKAEDVMLMPNDIVEVPTSSGKELLRSLLGAVAPAASQLPIRVIP